MSNDSATIWVRNFPPTATRDDIIDVLATTSVHEPPLECHVARDRITGLSRQLATVKYRRAADAERVAAELNGVLWETHPVSFTIPAPAAALHSRSEQLWTKASRSQIFSLRLDKEAEFSVSDQENADDITNLVVKLLLLDAELNPAPAESAATSTLALPLPARPFELTDATSCVGGNTISFARAGTPFVARVNGVEIDPDRFTMLRHNLSVFHVPVTVCDPSQPPAQDDTTDGDANTADASDTAAADAADSGSSSGAASPSPSPVFLYQCGFSSVLPVLARRSDALFVDPPWGGRDYKFLTSVALELGGVPVGELCRRVRALSATPAPTSVPVERPRRCRVLVAKCPNNVDEHAVIRPMLLAALSSSPGAGTGAGARVEDAEGGVDWAELPLVARVRYSHVTFFVFHYLPIAAATAGPGRARAFDRFVSFFRDAYSAPAHSHATPATVADPASSDAAPFASCLVTGGAAHSDLTFRPTDVCHSVAVLRDQTRADLSALARSLRPTQPSAQTHAQTPAQAPPASAPLHWYRLHPQSDRVVENRLRARAHRGDADKGVHGSGGGSGSGRGGGYSGGRSGREQQQQQRQSRDDDGDRGGRNGYGRRSNHSRSPHRDYDRELSDRDRQRSGRDRDRSDRDRGRDYDHRRGYGGRSRSPARRPPSPQRRAPSPQRRTPSPQRRWSRDRGGDGGGDRGGHSPCRSPSPYPLPRPRDSDRRRSRNRRGSRDRRSAEGHEDRRRLSSRSRSRSPRRDQGRSGSGRSDSGRERGHGGRDRDDRDHGRERSDRERSGYRDREDPRSPVAGGRRHRSPSPGARPAPALGRPSRSSRSPRRSRSPPPRRRSPVRDPRSPRGGRSRSPGPRGGQAPPPARDGRWSRGHSPARDRASRDSQRPDRRSPRRHK